MLTGISHHVQVFCSTYPIPISLKKSCVGRIYGQDDVSHRNLHGEKKWDKSFFAQKSFCHDKWSHVHMGLWKLPCAPLHWYRAMLCTIDLHCTWPTWVVHHGAQGRSIFTLLIHTSAWRAMAERLSSHRALAQRT